MDTKSMLTLLVVVAFTILLLVFRNKISQKLYQCFQKLSGFLPKGFTHWLSTWWSYFRDMARRLFKTFWSTLANYSVLILLLYTLLITWTMAHSNFKVLPLDALESANMIISTMFFIPTIGFGILIFVSLFFLSLHHQGRKGADRIFKFAKPTKLEVLEKRAGKLEALEKRVGKTEGELPKVNKRLGNIEDRLGNIEVTLKKMAKPHTPQKPKPRKTKRTAK